MLMLTLKKIDMTDVAPGIPAMEFLFDVRHNVGVLKTSINFDFRVQLDKLRGEYSATLLIDGLKADSLDNAQRKMGNWCTRLGAALANTNRKPGDVPTYECAEFELATQPAWVQAEFARMAPRFAACALPDANETSSDIFKEMIADGNPLINIYGAYDQLQMLIYPDD